MRNAAHQSRHSASRAKHRLGCDVRLRPKKPVGQQPVEHQPVEHQPVPYMPNSRRIDDAWSCTVRNTRRPPEGEMRLLNSSFTMGPTMK